jgi:predicted outer membrane repeat protein
MLSSSKLSPLAVAIAMAGTPALGHTICNNEAVDIQVTSTSDVSDPNDGVITLREAISAASTNCNEAADNITFSDSIAGRTITVDTSETGLIYNGEGDTLNLTASADQNITIKRSHGTNPLLKVSAAELNIENLNFDDNGVINGVSILQSDSSAILNIKNSSFSNNQANSGGAIYTSGAASLSVEDSNFDGNSASSYGGAIRSLSTDTINIKNSNFDNNNSTNEKGGALHIEAAKNVVIDASSFRNNQAQQEGGAIYVSAAESIQITDSVFDGNSADVAGAVQLMNNGSNPDVQIENSEFKNNSSQYKGGAVQYYHNSESNSAITIKSSQFVNNEANKGNEGHQGGAINIRGNYMVEVDAKIEDSTFTGNKAYGGSAISAYADSVDIKLTVANSTFNDNQSRYDGGAIWMRPTESGNIELSVNNSTFSGNSSIGYDDYSGNGNGGYGGAISLWNAESNTGIEINHTTIVNNTAEYGGGFHASANNPTSPIVIKNSLIGGNTSTNGHQDIDNDVLAHYSSNTVVSFENSVIGDIGGAASEGNNWENKNDSSLIGNDGTDGSSAALNIDGMIGPLQDNGGPTLSHYPLGAELIDQGAESDLTSDQRGVSRSDGNPDIGAIEDSSSALIWQNFNDSNELILTTGQAINLSMDDYIVDGDKFALTYQADNLPAGLALSEDGLLTGSIESEGSYAIIINVQDNYGGSAQSPQLNLTVSAPSKSNGGGAVFWGLLFTALISTFRRGK